MGERACSGCGAMFPVEKLVLTGDGALCRACEVAPTEDVVSYEKKLHRRSASGALSLAILTAVAAFTMPIMMAVTAAVFVKLASNAWQGAEKTGDPMPKAIVVLAGVVIAIAVALRFLR